MLRVLVQVLYGSLCAMMLVAALSYFRLPDDIVWFDIAPLIIIALSALSLVAFLARGQSRYLILTGCSGSLFAMGVWAFIEMAMRVADSGDDYVPSSPELILHFVLVAIPLAMLVLAIGRSKMKHA